MGDSGTVVKQQEETRPVPILAAYQEAIVGAYNAQAASGRMSREGARVMVGFLTGATVALRVMDHGLWAQRFEHAARRLGQDWTVFPREMQKLNEDIQRGTF